MLPEVQSLLIVQDRDQKIQSLQQELTRIPRERARAEDQLKANKQAVSTAKAAVQENEIAAKAIELDIATRRNTIEKLQVQQFETKKNEEFTSLGNDIIRYTENIDELETAELELLETADALIATHTAAVTALEKSMVSVAADISALEEKAEQDKARLEELLPEREALAQKIDGNLLTLYERLFKSKGNDPVSPLKDSQCGGCHMKVTATTVVNVQAEKAPTQCENCGRILYSV